MITDAHALQRFEEGTRDIDVTLGVDADSLPSILPLLAEIPLRAEPVHAS